ncbi:MAG: PspC domain-containing protein [Planctomycetota bacterium]
MYLISAVGLAILAVLAITVIPIILATVLIYLVVRRITATPVKAADLPDAQTRHTVLRGRDVRFQEERARILGMVRDGKVAAVEADRLLEALERETTVMACPLCGESIQVGAMKCPHCRGYLTEGLVEPRRLIRSRHRVLAGVCGGLAEYFELDHTLVRIVTALVVIFTGVVTGLIVYLVAALIMPRK